MKRSFAIVLALAFSLLVPTSAANAWDVQATNPFPGVAFGAAVPGYSKTITCSDTPQVPDECIRNGGGQVSCPEWTANDISWNYRPDGSVASLTSWCRNSWTPPTTAADDEDFRNRQNLAIAEATSLSQAWNNEHPGQQKCFQWGPVVHANGISVASGGVCANPVAAPVAASSDGSDNASPAPVSSDSVDSSDKSLDSKPETPTVDLSLFGIGRPFTTVILGSNSLNSCPAGFQSAANPIYGVGNSTATECWPAAAWAAYSLGGTAWANFKNDNISEAAKELQTLSVELNRIKALALNRAQTLANTRIGENVCVSWSLGDQSGSECAYIPVQNSGPVEIPVYVVPDAISVDTKQSFSGTVLQLQEAVTNVVGESALAKAINSVLAKVAALSKKTIKATAKLPTASSVDYVARSSTPLICSVSKSKIIVKKNGNCTIKYSVTYDSSSSTDTLDPSSTFVLTSKIKVKK
jgi:hypothetical protein